MEGRMFVTEVVTLMEGEWSCYGGGQFKGGSGHVIVFSLMERERSCYGGGQVVTLMEGEFSCYKDGV